MSRREDIDRLREQAETEDLPTLESVHKQLQEMLATLNANVSGTKDPDVLSILTELRDEATCIDDDVKRRIAEIKVDMLDPAYEQRKAERERKKLEEQREAEMWQQRLATEGIGGIFKGLGDVFGGKQPGFGASAAPSDGAIASATAPALHCTNCQGSLSSNVKFCPECGQPVPKEKHCTQCGFKLQPNAKFCPECGTKAN